MIESEKKNNGNLKENGYFLVLGSFRPTKQYETQ